MKKLILVFVVLGMFISGCVQFGDPQIEALVRDQLDKDPVEFILPDDMIAIVNVTLEAAGVFSLGGLEYALNMTTLRVSGNDLVGIAPLVTPTKLRFVYLSENEIPSFSPLSNDVSMQEFWGDNNNVTDISFVTGWLHPWYINVSWNPIVDISPFLVPGWTGSVQLDVRGCPLNTNSCTVVIPELISRGHTVSDTCP